MASTISISRNGRFVALRRGAAIEVVDIAATSPRWDVAARDDAAFACVGAELWLVDEDRLVRRRLDTAATIGEPYVVRTRSLRPVPGAAAAIADAEMPVLLEAGLDLAPWPLAPGHWLPGFGRRLVRVDERGGCSITVAGRGSPEVRLPIEGLRAREASGLFGGRVLAVRIQGDDDQLVVLTAAGALVHRIDVPSLDAVGFAEQAGMAIAAAGDEVLAIDLRRGVISGRGRAPYPVRELAADADARRIVVAGGCDGDAPIALVTYDELFRSPSSVVATSPGVDPDAAAVASAPRSSLDELTAAPAELDEPDEPIEVPDVLPLALAKSGRAPHRPPSAPPGGVPFDAPGEHLHALVSLTAARAALAIAEAWHSGRLSRDVEGELPCEHEVLGLVGDGVGLAGEALGRARTRLAARASETGARALASLAAGQELPFIALACELELTPVASQLLLVAAAPSLRGDVARLYGVLSGRAGRCACDLELAARLLDGASRDVADQIVAELAPTAPLRRRGAVRLEAQGDQTVLVVDEVVLDRLRGLRREVEISVATTRRRADRSLDEVLAPPTVKRALVLALAGRDPARPARVVVRGRRGCGRHTLVAALAARVGRDVAAIDVGRLPRGGAALARALALELVRADLEGAVPVVSALEELEASDGEARHLVRGVLRAHGGPLVIRTTPEGDLPLDPDHLAVVLPALALGERTTCWERALAAKGLVAPGGADALATRFRFGAGTIARVVDEVARRVAHGAADLAGALEEVAGQHTAVRLGTTATRVTRLPDWGQVTLLDDMRDSVRELVGRVRHQRTVYEHWGYDRRITTARGLTALFYGPPGTGKTLVAGLVARELGLELWRIDLARVMSKWVGETEKNLGEVFDAAEEGQVMLLFDEADSLFGKRTEVKSSNDRFANLEVNYLLQRLDGFDGVAVLTTNLEGSIDPAFKRRLSMRLYFPFPDEELREELWRTHVPPQVPTAGDFDFAELARRFPLSGGYIRNSALRAAFLAAQEARPLEQAHLLRAVQLEYRELGKLAASGRVE